MEVRKLKNNLNNPKMSGRRRKQIHNAKRTGDIIIPNNKIILSTDV